MAAKYFATPYLCHVKDIEGHFLLSKRTWEPGLRFTVSPLVFLERHLGGLGCFWCLVCVFFWWFCFGLCWFLLFCVALTGPSSDKTSESTNESLSGFAKTATIVTMSAATVQKRKTSSFLDFCYVVWPGFTWPGFTTSCRRTFERILSLPLVLHLCLTMFHEARLVKLLALANFQAHRRCWHLVSRVSPDDFQPVVMVLPVLWTCTVILDAHSCHRLPSRPVHRQWLDSGMVFSSLTHSTAEGN